MEGENRREIDQQQKSYQKMKQKLQGEDIGLMIYTSKSSGWLKTIMSKNDLIQELQDNRYKMIHTGKLMEEERK